RPAHLVHLDRHTSLRSCRPRTATAILAVDPHPVLREDPVEGPPHPPRETGAWFVRQTWSVDGDPIRDDGRRLDDGSGSAAVGADGVDTAALAAELRAALAPDRVRTDGIELALYGRDASVLHGEAAV